MIARVLEQEKAILKVLSSDRKTRHLVPSWQDTEVLEPVHNALYPLVEFTDALSDALSGEGHLFCDVFDRGLEARRK